MDEEALRAMLPAGFGKPNSTRQGKEKGKKSAPNPTPVLDMPATQSQLEPPQEWPRTNDQRQTNEVQETHTNRESNEHESGGSRMAHEFDVLKEFASLPLTRSIQLKGHTKSVSAVAIDRSGARVATGSTDYDVKMWDFGGMSSDLRPFKSFEPAENYPVIELAFAPRTKNLLCLNAATQPRVYDYDGHELAVYKKGDVFMRDMRHTTGHISDITCGAWHPIDDTQFMTGGTDSTVRLWDVNYKASQKTVIVVRSKDRGTKTKVSAATFTPDAQAIIAAAQDGALYMWSTKGQFSRPAAHVLGAHRHSEGATGLAISPDGSSLASRGADNTLKLWDLRMLRTPVAVQQDLPNGSECTDVLYSPDGSQVLTGVASVKGGSLHTSDVQSQWGQLAVFSSDKLESQLVYPVAQSSVVRVAWHPRLNQVFASTRDGDVHVYYDEQASHLGALLSVKKRARTRTNPYVADPSKSDPYADVPILVPEESERDDWLEPVYKKPQYPRNPKNARVPERPLQGRGKGGRIGRSAMQPLMMDLWEGDLRSEDPREALLKYADKAKNDPRWTSVYAKTQPTTIFAQDDDDTDHRKGNSHGASDRRQN